MANSHSENVGRTGLSHRGGGGHQRSSLIGDHVSWMNGTSLWTLSREPTISTASFFKGGRGGAVTDQKYEKKKYKMLRCVPPRLGVEERGRALFFECPHREKCLGSGDASAFEKGACRTATTSMVCLVN